MHVLYGINHVLLIYIIRLKSLSLVNVVNVGATLMKVQKIKLSLYDFSWKEKLITN